jgi:hypothetical protein
LERFMSTTLDTAVPATPDRVVPPDLDLARSLHGRLNRVLAELGLDEALTPRWAVPARSGFFFAPHNLHQAARLVDALERLGHALDGTATQVPVPVADPGTDTTG